MPRGETITIEISPSAEVEVTVQGVKGKGCKALTAALEKELGVVLSDTPTREMNEREVRNVVQHHNRA